MKIRISHTGNDFFLVLYNTFYQLDSDIWSGCPNLTGSIEYQICLNYLEKCGQTVVVCFNSIYLNVVNLPTVVVFVRLFLSKNSNNNN